MRLVADGIRAVAASRAASARGGYGIVGAMSSGVIQRHDTMAVAVLLVLTAASQWERIFGPSLIGMDTATAFYPWYGFLGEQLRAGHLPVWNPHQFSGTPFAADPESGWMYLPAMLAFTALPLEAAAKAHVVFHVALAGLGMYAFTRLLGASIFGGLLAATIYAHSGFLEGHAVCCFAYSDVAAWLPLMLLGAERAIRGAGWRVQATWWGVAGLSLSQILSAWVGQGAYYAALVLGSYLGYRTLFAAMCTPAARVRSFARHLTGMLLFGLALAAAGLLPRLEYNLVSNLPGGYPSASVSLFTSWSDWGIIDGWQRLLLQPGFAYVGWPALALAVAAPLVARRRRGVSYFALLGVAVLVLARAEPTPLHALMGWLPGFERIHARSPERALIVFYLAPAVLAAATLTALKVPGRPLLNALVGTLVLVVVSVDLHTAWTAQEAESLASGGDYPFLATDLGAYYAPSGAALFLQSKAATDRFRYFGYAQHVYGGPMPYTLRWADPNITALQVNNRALVTGLDDIQGYNPIHVARYDDFIAALNGHSQNYHHADVFDTGLRSRLLDVLNVRYVLVPAVTASDEIAPALDPSMRTVYQDARVSVLENPSALPRAWLVHAAQQVAPGAAAGVLAAGSVDLREVAVLEEAPPFLAAPDDASRDAVQIVSDAPDRIQLRVTSQATAMIVLSEVYYPAWRASVDGQATRLYIADHALRAVAVPSGEHDVELRYESVALTAGLIVSAAAFVALIALAACAVYWSRNSN